MALNSESKTTKGKLADLIQGGEGRTAQWWKEFDELYERVGMDAIDGFYSATLDEAKGRAERAEATAAHERAKRETAERTARHVTENLTATQRRCTELLNAKRLGEYFEKKPGDESAFLALAWNMEKARAKHPKGPDGVRSLGEEFGEVCNAIRRKTLGDVRDELLDLATVAMRLYLGECQPTALQHIVRVEGETIAEMEVSR